MEERNCFHVKMAALIRPECVDFLAFQEILKKMRLLDDTIIYALNVHLPTESFKGQRGSEGEISACKDLFSQLETNYKDRESAINKCLEYSVSQVSQLREKKKLDENNITLNKQLRNEQSKLRILQTELGVEEVIKGRTNKVFYERCRPYYLPSGLKL